jgi:thiamine-phosphate pyrophosphorylase
MAEVDFRLYLITDRHQTQSRDLFSIVGEACEAGVKAIQLREKDLPASKLFSLAENLKSLCRQNSAKLLINERADIALALDLDGVQLTSRSYPVHAARKVLAAEKLIGVSTHSLREAENAQESGCDFILFGPIFPTSSKAKYGEPRGLGRLNEVARRIKLPVFAVGGIDPERAKQCRDNGAFGVAVISAIMNAENTERKIGEFDFFLGNL